MPVKDRRSSLRVELEGRARIRTDRDLFEGRCVDLGLHGIAIQSTRAVRPGEAVTLEAMVEGQHLRMEATLIRRQRHRGDYVLGFAFVDLDLDTQRRIEHLVFERVDGSPQAELMRAFVAHADRVPPPAARDDAGDRTVVAGTLVPVISGDTQIVQVGMLPRVDHTVIAPPPSRGETVIAPIETVVEARPVASPPADSPAASPGVPDDAWLEDEMDTAQFRLLEAAQAREAAEQELSRLEPDEPVPENTVVVGGFSLPQLEPSATAGVEAPPSASESTVVVGGFVPERPLVERTLVTADPVERPLAERTLVERALLTSDAPERTLVTVDPGERPLAERTAAFAAGMPTLTPRTPTTALSVVIDPGEHSTAPTEPFHATGPESRPEPPGERTLPFLRDFLVGLRNEPAVGGPPSEPSERTTVTAGGLPETLALGPAARALLDATALLRRPAPASRCGPRVIVAVPHQSFRRVAPTPWNRR